MADIEKFLEIFQEYKEEQENQKRRGLNDFNIFTTLLNKSDEVRLHSKFLHFLLNPAADHSQGSLFLDLFLKCFNASDDQKAHSTSNGWKNKRIKRLLSESNLNESISFMY